MTDAKPAPRLACIRRRPLRIFGRFFGPSVDVGGFGDIGHSASGLGVTALGVAEQSSLDDVIDRLLIAPAGVDDERCRALDEFEVEAVMIGGEQHAVGGGQGCGRERHGFQVEVVSAHLDEARHVGVGVADLSALGLKQLHEREGRPFAAVVDVFLNPEAEELGGGGADDLVDVDVHLVSDNLELFVQTDVDGAVEVFEQLGHLGGTGGAEGDHLADDLAVEGLAGAGEAAEHLEERAGAVGRIAGVFALGRAVVSSAFIATVSTTAAKRSLVDHCALALASASERQRISARTSARHL